MSFTERRQRVTDTSGTLVLLELTAPSFSGPVRLVNDTQDYTVGGHLYTALPFRFKWPEDTEGKPPAVLLEIDNIGREVTADLENMGPGEILTTTMHLTDRADPTTFEQSMVLPMTNVHVDPLVISAQLSVDYIMGQQACRLRYNGHTAPGLF